jgi:hypothetical protein
MYEPMATFTDEDGRSITMAWVLAPEELRKTKKPHEWQRREVDPGQVNYYRSIGWTTDKPKEVE